MQGSLLLALGALSTMATAYDLPDNLKKIYNDHKSGTCSNKLSGTFTGGAAYCGDISNVIYLKGGKGNYDNMDVDCDGANNSGGDCANDPSGQGETAFKDTVKGYGIGDLDANIHTYIVFGNEGGKTTFKPQDHGIKPLSLMAVVCGGKLHYGIWGDTNGGTSTGEASIAMAKLCFPKDGLNGNKGHDEKDVMYIAFSGKDAVPGKDGAKWKAKNQKEFSDSLKTLGDKLVKGL
ncbi:hypothetical protein VHEMI00779 [[Torrubiella] hemipterigena]|uniref:Endo-chitosanase n=1 Tax=[Torrubiella] hemipterigena TaxID=1531966 RepID=A0A0A1T3D9_9HYPO|nr:hypothetical protein VHEMI00779 [[Torrubiella] hemipterigena]